MKDYAVIRIKGNQYKVSPGDEILVAGDADEKVKADVLLLVKNGKVVIGKPSISGHSLKFKKVADKVKGEKIEVFKYKAKSRYRKKMGFRSISTKLLVEEIN